MTADYQYLNAKSHMHAPYNLLGEVDPLSDSKDVPFMEVGELDYILD